MKHVRDWAVERRRSLELALERMYDPALTTSKEEKEGLLW